MRDTSAGAGRGWPSAFRPGINTARFCFGYGAGYDAIHEFLSADDRKKIAAGMIRLGVLPTLDDWVLPEKRIHALDSMGHNWWSVCVAMAGVAALALIGDDPRAPGWAEAVLRGLAEWFGYRGNVLQNKPANFDPAGAFYESLGYTDYALSEYLRFRLAYSNTYRGRRQPRFAPLDKTADFFLRTLYPTSSGFYTPNLGDGSLRQRSAPRVRLLVETGFAHPSAGWYLKKTAGNEAPDPLELLSSRPVPSAPPGKLPQSVLYSEIGWAAMRSSWKDDATFLAMKSGFAWNHAHADAGSFLMFHAGEPLIADSGACSYSRREYGDYYVQSRALNVILFNGEGEPREDIRHGLKYVYADATGPMSRYFSRNYRHWLWIGNAILIFDDVLAHEAGRLDWLLHYDGKAELQGNQVVLTNRQAKAAVRFLHPQDLAVREEQGMPDHRPDERVPYFAFSPRTAARECTPETVTRYFVSCASYRRKNGRVVLDSLTKTDSVWRPRGAAQS
ncbi:MAG: heparinase II/III-family protein [Acidobacteria bacterium]|nr:heparinase II/III-family protein [Acidobacteriota bacterium]